LDYERNLKKVPFYVIIYLARNLAQKKGNIQFCYVECLPNKKLFRHSQMSVIFLIR